MRLFEILILISLTLNFVHLSMTNLSRRLIRTALTIINWVLVVLHWIIEGSRWQMYPAYFLSVFFPALWLLEECRGHKRNRISLGWVSILISLVLLLISIGLPLLLPVPELQDPSGEYAVGTTTIHLIDTERSDPYAPDPTAPRELLVQIWYPAVTSSSDVQAPWMQSAEIVAPRIAEWIELPSFFLNHLKLAKSKTIQDAEPLTEESPYPVLIFSHGYGGFRAQNTNQAQELASHGFIVFGVEHTYAAVVTVFPDGRVADHNPDTLPDGLPEQESLDAARALGSQWAQDLEFVLDTIIELDEVNLQGSFQTIIDTDSIGVFGHSTGAGAAIEFCARDQRCDAVLTMDAYMKPVSSSTYQQGISIPALHMFSEDWQSEENSDRFNLFMQSVTGPSVSITIEGTDHYDFSDLPLLTPLAHTIGLKGSLSSDRVIEIVNTLSTSYFQQTLKKNYDGSFTLPLERFPEIRSNL